MIDFWRPGPRMGRPPFEVMSGTEQHRSLSMAFYDVIIVGAGVGGAALAAAFGSGARSVLLVERDLSERKLFIGELLQPGGVSALERLGLDACLRDIDAQRNSGFAVISGEEGQALAYPPHRDSDGQRRQAFGYSFHHGRFVQRLREAATAQPTVDVQQGTVIRVVEEGGRLCGVCYRDRSGNELEARAHLLVGADGRASRLRRQVAQEAQPKHLSYSVGVLLTDAQLPFPNHGNVFVAQPAPMLAYQISTKEVRILVDIPGQLPNTRNGELVRWMQENVEPQLPQQLRAPFRESLATRQLRAMPTLALSARPSHCDQGALLIGDALNMRHPLTGSGMTVALHDARLISELFEHVDLRDTAAVTRLTRRFYADRRALALTVDMLAGALYEVFCGRWSGVGADAHSDVALLAFWRAGRAWADVAAVGAFTASRDAADALPCCRFGWHG